MSGLLLPRSLEEALLMLSERPEAQPVAGGTDLLRHWPDHPDRHPRPLLDLSGVPELRGRSLTRDCLTLGATTTWWEVVQDPAIAVEFPLLAAAARQVGSIQVQARGTWGGNIANASPAADGVLVLLACDATVEVRSARGRSEVPLDEFLVGNRRTRLQPDQLVTAIRIPRRVRQRQYFEKVGSRRAQTIGKVAVAICQLASGWRVAVGSMAPMARRCPSLERALASSSRPGAAEDWLPLIRADLSPIDDIRATAHYREQVLARLLLAFTMEGRGSD